MATGNWIKLGHHKLDSSADKVEVTWTGQYDNIRFEYSIIQSGSNGIDFRAKTDAWKNSSSDYYYRYQARATSGSTTTDANGDSDKFWGNYGDTSALHYVAGVITNQSGYRKVAQCGMTSNKNDASDTGTLYHTKWYSWLNDTSNSIQGLRVEKESTRNDFSAGSEIIVWGQKDGTTNYPNLPNGTTFLTSDTNKLFMFDGTDTWNEVS